MKDRPGSRELSTGKVVLELICSSAEDCVRAEQGGADRIELCAALELGGLTPSAGTLEQALRRTRLPIIAMVRPRTGGFSYTESEFEAMKIDVRRFRDMGAQGVVFGVLTKGRQVDVARTRELVEQAASIETVFHRAFDAVMNPFEALEALIQLKITRVLTSGQSPSAIEGAALIKQLLNQAAGRIELLPGGGLRAENLASFLVATCVSQVHMSAFETLPDPSMQGTPIEFNGRAVSEMSYRAVSDTLVSQAARKLLEAGGNDARHDVALRDQK